MKTFIIILAFSLSSVMAQFGRDDDQETTSTQDAVDACDVALRTPVIRPFLAPVVDVDALVEKCDLESEVEQIHRASKITEHDGDCPDYLGRLSANPYAADSTANPYSQAGSPYSSKSVNNPYGPYGSPYSPVSARNPYATDAPKIVAQDGTCLGELSDNPYDPDSAANPYGRYGSKYSPTSINNPYSTYGSPYSSQSPNNPYATQAPLIFGR